MNQMKKQGTVRTSQPRRGKHGDSASKSLNKGETMLSANIKKLRKEAGLSQERMAEELCVSRQAVTKWETDGGTPDLDNLQAIARFRVCT